MTVRITPQGGNFAVDLEASNWQPPLGTALQLSGLTAHGIATQHQIRFDRVEGRAYGGTLEGKGVVDWSSTPKASGQFELQGVNLASALAALGSQASIEGTLQAAGSFTSRADTAGRLAEAANIDAAFMATEGRINGIDLAGAMVPGSRTSVTRFDKLAGQLQLTDGVYRYRKLALDTAQFHARGSVDIQANQDISGALHAELAVPSRRMHSQLTLSGKTGDVRVR